MKILTLLISAGFLGCALTTLLPNAVTASTADTAECLAGCARAFRSCSDGGTKNVAECVKRRTACINGCK